MADIQAKKGCASENTVVNDTTLPNDQYIAIDETDTIIADAYPYRVKGYVAVNADIQSLKQAIYQNGIVGITITVGDYNTTIAPGTIGQHRVALIGYDGDTFIFRNSWTSNWGDSGNGKFIFSQHQGKLYDAMVFVDIPDELLLKAKTMYKYFKDSEVVGLKPELVTMLDQARGIAGVPFIITSGYRDPAHNAEVGGVQDSAHETGLAVDLLVKDSVSGGKILLALSQVGFKRFGFYVDNHIHCDIDNSKPNPCYWVK